MQTTSFTRYNFQVISNCTCNVSHDCSKFDMKICWILLKQGEMALQ